MSMLSKEKINFKSLEEKTFKEMMKLGREIIQEELREIDNLILKYRDKDTFEPKANNNKNKARRNTNSKKKI